MPEISSDARCVDNIVEGQVGDELRLLQEKRQGLTNTAGGTANCYFDHFDRVGEEERESVRRVGSSRAPVPFVLELHRYGNPKFRLLLSSLPIVIIPHLKRQSLYVKESTALCTIFNLCTELSFFFPEQYVCLHIWSSNDEL